MDRASSLIFPGSRTLAGWWRQLAPLKPRALAIGYGFLHRIEAPVHVQAEEPIDPLAHFVLQALSLDDRAGLDALQDRLRLPGPVVQRVLADMQAIGLLTASSAGGWQMTTRGQQALQRGAFPVRVCQRRVSVFLERLDPVGVRIGPPQYAPIAECAGVPWPVDEAHRFDIAGLRECVSQTPAWKQAHSFPLDVETLADGPDLESWQRVVVDRPERAMLALVLVDHDIRAFAVKVDGWTLFDRTPVLQQPADGSAWSELLQAPPIAVMQEAWRSWCKQRQLPANEVESCSLAYQPPRLEVQAPARLVQRLQAAKSDLFKGEAWLLVGDGYLRTAVQLSVRAQT